MGRIPTLRLNSIPAVDLGETNVAEHHPDVVKRLDGYMREAYTPSPLWSFTGKESDNRLTTDFMHARMEHVKLSFTCFAPELYMPLHDCWQDASQTCEAHTPFH